MFGTKKTDDEKAAAARARQVRVAASSVGILAMSGHFKMPGQTNVPIDGAKVTIERGIDVGRRVTATRVLLAGPFALLMKKDQNQLFITVEGADGSVLLHPVAAKKEAQARVFATVINGTSTGVDSAAD